MKPLDMSTPLDWFFPTITLCFHELSYASLLFLVQICFTWQFFPSLGTLEESVFEDHFHLLHILFAYPSYPPACCPIMSSTLLDIGTTWCDLAWEFDAHSVWGHSLYIFIDPEKIQKIDIFQKNTKKYKKIDIFQKFKKLIYFKKNPKKMIYYKKSKN